MKHNLYRLTRFLIMLNMLFSLGSTSAEASNLSVESLTQPAHGHLARLITSEQSTPPGATKRVSVASDGTQADFGSLHSAISDDGQTIAFQSSASNLVAGLPNGGTRIYLHKLLTGETSLVSVSFSGTPVLGDDPDISADGRFVTYKSNATDLVANDENGMYDIFVSDQQTGNTERVSIASDGAEANGHSHNPRISADGRFVVFYSNATNLVAGDTNGEIDNFVHDRQTGMTERISVASDGSQGNAQANVQYGISADGRFVVFSSAATNLVEGDTNGAVDVFVRDRLTAETERVPVASNGSEANSYSIATAISADGRMVVFHSNASNLVAGDANGVIDVFVHDRQTGETELVSASYNGTAITYQSLYPDISADGRFVSFYSDAPNLASGDTNGARDVFVRDLQNGVTEIISVSSAGTQGNEGSQFATLSGDGSAVAFYSGASNLVSGDTNDVPDIFVHERGTLIASSFLDLPIAYSNFAIAAQGNIGGEGRVNSWFDHTYPTNPLNAGTNNLTRWDGRVFDFKSSPSIVGENWYDGHNGIDFQRWNRDEQIFAAAPGSVLKTMSTCQEGDRACGSGYGNQVWIDHHNGYATLYAHLKSVYVAAGDPEITDPYLQPLGVMGNTGISEGTHLHFGVYYDQNGDGKWSENEVVDPYGWAGTGSDPWTGSGTYLWKYLLWTPQAAGSSGATVSSPSGNTSVNVPPGALNSTVTLELWDTPPVAKPAAQLRSSGQSFWLRVLEWLSGSSANSAPQAVSSGFTQPITVTVAYPETGILHLDESQLTIHYWNEGDNTWLALPTTVDPDQNQATAQTTEIGRFDLQGPLLCPADNKEPDDNYDAATTISTDGSSVTRLFDIAQDEDWFRLEAVAGEYYSIQTTNLSPGVDTMVELYDRDGVTLLALDDNSGAGNASELLWQAPADGIYFIRISQSGGSSFGCDATYDVHVEQQHALSEPSFKLYLPITILANPAKKSDQSRR